MMIGPDAPRRFWRMLPVNARQEVRITLRVGNPRQIQAALKLVFEFSRSHFTPLAFACAQASASTITGRRQQIRTAAFLRSP